MSEAQAKLFPDPNVADVVMPDLSRLVTASGFRALVERGDTAGAVVAKDFPDVRISQESDDGFLFVLTSGAVDRDHDIIEQGGLDWGPFRKNPTWLWSHDPTQLPIGLVTELDAGPTEARVKVRYVPATINPLGPAVREMHLFRLELRALDDAGGAASIGMLPIEFSLDRNIGGIRYRKSEPLEGSDVVLPANRDALLQMKAAGLSLEPFAEWAERLRKLVGSPDQPAAERIVRTLDPAPPGQVVVMQASGFSEALLALKAAAEKLTAAAGRIEQATAKKAAAAEPPAGETPASAAAPPEQEALDERAVAWAVRQVAEREFIARTGHPFRATTN